MLFDDHPLTRRRLLTALLLGFAVVLADPVFAKDGDDGDGDNSGGDDGGGNDNSGPGDSDDNDDDDKDDDSDSDDKKNADRQKLRSDVKNGKAASLKDILNDVRKKYPGQVVRVRLAGSVYRIRILDRSDRLIEVSVNAATRRITSVKGI